MSSRSHTMKEDKGTKLWPTQRATVARLGLLHRTGSLSRTSIFSIESSDTFVSDVSSSVKEEIYQRNVKNQRGNQRSSVNTAISENYEAMSDSGPTLKILQRKEVLDHLKTLKHPSLMNTPTKTSIFHNPSFKRKESAQSRLGASQVKEDRKKMSQLILSKENSWVTCADFTNSELLNSKTPEEREIFTQLCHEAIAERLKTFEKLKKINSDAYENRLQKITNLNRDNYKNHLCQVMLKLINNEQNRAEIKEQSYKRKEKPLLWTHKYLQKQKLIQQVYVVGGRTIVGTPSENGTYPNTFASVSSLMDVQYDTPGYHRFTISVDVGDLTGEEIMIQVHNGRNLIFMKQSMEDGSNVKKVIQKIILPEGVFADKLRVAREGNGPLILQEPWKF